MLCDPEHFDAMALNKNERLHAIGIVLNGIIDVNIYIFAMHEILLTYSGRRGHQNYKFSLKLRMSKS